MAPITRTALYFTAPYQTAFRTESLNDPAPGQVRVRVAFSAISPGTEMLIYRGQMPQGMRADATIAALVGALAYPLKYGYATVGQVEAVGKDVDEAWLGRWVFAFQPHQSHYLASVSEVLPLPLGISPEDATFLPNTETAVNFLMDGRPMLGERVVVFGQGIVGLLTTALLAAFPLERLIVLDRFPLRRKVGLALGAHQALDPADAHLMEALTHALGAPQGTGGADLIYELSGAPAALNMAIAITGFGGRVVIGSWYGQKRTPLDLGGHFHRSRIRLISSQVSTLAPEHTGRWDKARRMALAWHHVAALRPASRFVTHRFPAADAAAAYAQIDQHPEETLQVLLVWSAS